MKQASSMLQSKQKYKSPRMIEVRLKSVFLKFHNYMYLQSSEDDFKVFVEPKSSD